MSKNLHEEDISMGFRAPFYSITTCIPECNVCIYWENAKNSVIHQMNLDGVNGTTVQMLF